MEGQVKFVMTATRILAAARIRTLARSRLGALGPAPPTPMAEDVRPGSILAQRATTSRRRNLSRDAQAPNKVKLIWAGLDFTAGLPATRTLRPDWTYLAVSSRVRAYDSGVRNVAKKRMMVCSDGALLPAFRFPVRTFEKRSSASGRMWYRPTQLIPMRGLRFNSSGCGALNVQVPRVSLAHQPHG